MSDKEIAAAWIAKNATTQNAPHGAPWLIAAEDENGNVILGPDGVPLITEESAAAYQTWWCSLTEEQREQINAQDAVEERSNN